MRVRNAQRIFHRRLKFAGQLSIEGKEKIKIRALLEKFARFIYATNGLIFYLCDLAEMNLSNKMRYIVSLCLG